MTTAERRQQRRLEGKERPKEQVAPGRRGGGGVVGDAVAGGGTGSDESRETRVLFTCDMLLREERTRKDKHGKLVSDWISMTCGDPDDFQTLKERHWSTETEVKADDLVILWRIDASAPPDGQKGYVRSGKVMKVVLAGEVVDDPEIRRYDLRSGAGRKPQQQYHNTRGNKVVLRLRAEDGHAVPWAELPELHLEEPAQNTDAVGSAGWRVLPEPRPVTSVKDQRYANVRRELLDPPHHGILARLADVRAKLSGGGRLRRPQLEDSLRSLLAQSQDPPLHNELLLIPAKRVPLRFPKFDVRLKQSALRAVQAQQTILTRMVMFHCNWCTNRFPAFHPAYEPPDWLPMELLKRGASGVAACNIEVATWDEVPPFSPPEEDLVVAACHTGVCRGCHLDIRAQRAALGEDASDAAIVPKMSFLNHMDPVFRFPHEELQDLFDQASVIEAMLLALEHMQVSFVTVARAGLHKFRQNVISFPQDVPTFAMRAGLLQRYQKRDRVNSVRGPGDQRDRPVRYAYAHPADRGRFATDENGCLVYPATVREVLPDGLVLDYTDASRSVWLGEGFEEVQHIWPRI